MMCDEPPSRVRQYRMQSMRHSLQPAADPSPRVAIGARLAPSTHLHVDRTSKRNLLCRPTKVNLSFWRGRGLRSDCEPALRELTNRTDPIRTRGHWRHQWYGERGEPTTAENRSPVNTGRSFGSNHYSLSQDDTYSANYRFEDVLGKLPYTVGECPAIDREYLRNISY